MVIFWVNLKISMVLLLDINSNGKKYFLNMHLKKNNGLLYDENKLIEIINKYSLDFVKYVKKIISINS